MAAPAADGPSWSASPVPPEGAATDEARPFFYLEGPPGTVLKDTLALTNESGEPRTFRLRAADAYNTRDGGSAVRGEGRGEGAGKWLDLAQETVEVPPRTRAEVPLRVTVPDSAVPGDHPAAVVVSDGERSAGVRLHLRVSGPSLAALSVEDVSVHERADGAAGITYTLVNRGSTALRPRLAFRADGLFGQLTHRGARRLPLELLPGQRVTRHERWSDPPVADLAHVRLTVTAGGGARDQSTASYTAVPWGWGGGVLLVAVAGGVGWYLRGRRRGNGPGRAVTTTAQGGGTPQRGAGGVRGGGSEGEGSGGQHELTGAVT
ncbi:COG1470 family protein [Streptomyces reniochalinae]|uniref:COG1470 family protein n=1 Tax=Streptomyces reniochalinae TaxID=2250578 RepID=UPI0015F037EB|nr:hypothetical protein [Streptomyces reniochalinae]